jgi:muramoyltetrapeptide carboxypeptidase
MAGEALLRPRALAKGDLIGVAAPAGPFPEERFRIGLERLEELGFRVRTPRRIFQQEDYLAGSDENRALTLNRLLADPEVKAVMAARGGYGSMRILDRIDLAAVRAHPKIIIGFSDITALLLGLVKRTGLVCFHGPVVTSLADVDVESVRHLERLLTGQQVFPLPLDKDRILRPGRAVGPLLGGNLTLLVHLLATGWKPELTGAILFLEDTGEAPYRLDRMLVALKMSGVLERCAGVLLGHFEDCGTEDEIRSVLGRTLGDFPGPVAAGFPAGHGVTNLTLPVGPRAVLDTDNHLLDMIEPYLV